jgi:hypothetical protein
MDDDNIISFEDSICEKIDRDLIELAYHTDSLLYDVHLKYGYKYKKLTEDCLLKDLICRIFENRYAKYRNDYSFVVNKREFIKELNLEELLANYHLKYLCTEDYIEKLRTD